MRILTTFPGKYGDLIWALPSIRALSRRIGAPVDLLISGECASIVPLLQTQGYLGTVTASSEWAITYPATVPAIPYHTYFADRCARYDAVFHLAYRGWPQLALPFETLDCLNDQIVGSLVQHDCGNSFLYRELALDEPWITVKPWTQIPHALIIGFSDNHFELKYGLLKLLNLHMTFSGTGFLLVAPNSRWATETPFQSTDWIENAKRLTAAKVFLGCCSALHVLACAVGTKVVMMEPMEARWNDIFYPYGKTGPQVTLVLGNDGLPTFDARAVRQAVEEALRG